MMSPMPPPMRDVSLPWFSVMPRAVSSGFVGWLAMPCVPHELRKWFSEFSRSLNAESGNAGASPYRQAQVQYLGTGGEVTALDKNLWKMPTGKIDKFRLDHCGFIFQGFNLFASLTALQMMPSMPTRLMTRI